MGPPKSKRHSKANACESGKDYTTQGKYSIARALCLIVLAPARAVSAETDEVHLAKLCINLEASRDEDPRLGQGRGHLADALGRTPLRLLGEISTGDRTFLVFQCTSCTRYIVE